MHNEMPDKPKSPTSFDSKAEKAVKRTKPQKEASKGSYYGKEKQKAISIGSTPEDDNKRIKLGCKIRMLVGYGDTMKRTQPLSLLKRKSIINFSIKDGTR